MRSLVFEGNTWLVYEELREKDKKLLELLAGIIGRKACAPTFNLYLLLIDYGYRGLTKFLYLQLSNLLILNLVLFQNLFDSLLSQSHLSR